MIFSSESTRFKEESLFFGFFSHVIPSLCFLRVWFEAEPTFGIDGTRFFHGIDIAISGGFLVPVEGFFVIFGDASPEFIRCSQQTLRFGFSFLSKLIIQLHPEKPQVASGIGIALPILLADFNGLFHHFSRLFPVLFLAQLFVGIHTA